MRPAAKVLPRQWELLIRHLSLLIIKVSLVFLLSRLKFCSRMANCGDSDVVVILLELSCISAAKKQSGCRVVGLVVSGVDYILPRICQRFARLVVALS